MNITKIIEVGAGAVIGLIVGLLGSYVLFIYFPWISIELRYAATNGYVIEGCQFKPNWLEKGTVYDCNSWSRQRYMQHVHEDFQEAEARSRGY